MQSSNAEAEEVEKLQDEIVRFKQILEEHQQEAQKSHMFYVDVSAHCKHEWDEIVELQKKASLSEEEKKELEYFIGKFNLVLCAIKCVNWFPIGVCHHSQAAPIIYRNSTMIFLAL